MLKKLFSRSSTAEAPSKNSKSTRRRVMVIGLDCAAPELVFDLWPAEEKEVRAMVEQKMKTAIELDVPIVVEMGVGESWIEAH